MEASCFYKIYNWKPIKAAIESSLYYRLQLFYLPPTLKAILPLTYRKFIWQLSNQQLTKLTLLSVEASCFFKIYNWKAIMSAIILQTKDFSFFTYFLPLKLFYLYPIVNLSGNSATSNWPNSHCKVWRHHVFIRYTTENQ